MILEGSCHCGSVTFSIESSTPVPYQRCYCSICRKTAGGGGYAINIMGKADTLKISGEDCISVYHAVIDGKESRMERRFCKKCGSALWGFHDAWPDLVHPFASAIDTPLPVPEQHVDIMMEFRAGWTQEAPGTKHVVFDGYPELSIEQWHKLNASDDEAL